MRDNRSVPEKKLKEENLMRPFSPDLKERIIKAHQESLEMTQSELAQRFLIAQSSVSRILGKFRRQESLVPKKKPGCPRKMSESDVKILEASVAQKNDRTLEEHVQELAKVGIFVSDSTVSRRLKDLKQTRKKKRVMILAEPQKKSSGKGKNLSNG
jgi:transposase